MYMYFIHIHSYNRELYSSYNKWTIREFRTYEWLHLAAWGQVKDVEELIC